MPTRPSFSTRQITTVLPLLAALVLGLGAVTGCGGPRSKMPNYVDVPLPMAHMPLNQTGAAISRACRLRGWRVEATRRGSLVATYRKRHLMASVRIMWTPNSYTILYRDSVGFGYQPARNAIHPRFVLWVRNLRRTIGKELARVGRPR